ncbi:unnamed protein product [Hyaloperonospora brassicae]|uniref:RxLR effector candidate protein n=1 Tax=Hyaloperonospora brassicae TaxID=162125 RepID=A0AAV0UAC6_HYABA|nr:unnamed protein product [Hyaloperonospora brassicae]
MRVYSLVFLTSSALSSRVDGVLEPASSNVTALDFPAVVRPLPDNDDDATASRSSTRDGPPDADERGPLVEPFSSAFSKIVGLGRRATLKGEQKEPQRSRLLMRDRVFVKYVDAALKDKEFGDLYRLYEASGQSMIDDLANHYGADVVARAVAAARKTNTDNPARFQEPSTTVEKLVKDLLQRWLKEKKELKDVFTALKINHYEFTAGELADILYNRQVDVSIVEFARKMTSPKLTLLEDYSKLKMADKSDVAYLRAIMDGFGGEKQLFLLLREANGKNFLIDKADELEDAFLKMCAFDGMSPSDAFKRLGTGQKAEEFFRTKRLDKMTKYVEDYNKKSLQHSQQLY